MLATRKRVHSEESCSLDTHQDNNMSIYKKFIDSAKKQDHNSREIMFKAQVIPNALCSTINSTPISKHQYRRLVESSDCANEAHQNTPQCTKPVQTVHLVHYHQQQRAGPHVGLNNIQQVCSPFSNRVRSNIEINHIPIGRQQAQNLPQTRQQQNQSKPTNWFNNVDDPTLLKWMQAMRFDTELECLTALQARTLAIDEHSAGALSVRNSQVAIQEMRLESSFIIELIDHLIDCLPLMSFTCLRQYSANFNELWLRITSQIETTLSASCTLKHQKVENAQTNYYMNVPKQNSPLKNQLTIINCTPRKSAVANERTLKPLDKLAMQIRTVCFEFSQILNEHLNEEQLLGCNRLLEDPAGLIDNGLLEANLRRIKEFYGKFVEISIRAECANIVRALEFDFSNSALKRLSSSSSVRPTRPYESSCAQLPLKWALIALWQLTKEDTFICRTLTERWQTLARGSSSSSSHEDDHLAGGLSDENARPRSRAAKRLDYSTKCDDDSSSIGCGGGQSHHEQPGDSLRCHYERFYQICQNDEEYRKKEEQLMRSTPQKKVEPVRQQQGALSSALKSNQERSVKQVSTIELLIEIIISQPNKHERVDMLNFIQSQSNKLIDFEELDQSLSAAIYTSNQYKVAALRILNHLCVKDQAIKTILKCLSTPPPTSGANHTQMFENKIIKSIFECYQTAQEHIYQNETVFNPQARRQLASGNGRRKRARQLVGQSGRPESGCSDEFSDYGSRQTNSGRSSAQQMDFDGWQAQQAKNDLYLEDDFEDLDGDDEVVREAIRLLVRVTTPFHRSQQAHDYYTLIGRFSIDSLVRYLSNIVKSTNNREMLLLSLSALANISFITTDPMRTHGTNRTILELFRASKVRSKDVELRDQAVTIMANAVENNLMDIVNNGGLTFLLSCLEVCPTKMANYKQKFKTLGSTSSNGLEEDNFDYRSLHEYTEVMGDTCSLSSANSKSYQQMANTVGEYKCRDRKPIILGSGDEVCGLLEDILECACDHQQTSQLMYTSMGTSPCLSRLTPSELAAMERIHQKTAVALARIAVDPITTKMVLKYGGVKSMIDLCKYNFKRNHSDTVLIACIATLRKISKVIGREVFRNFNALDLIELDPKSALKIYGNPSDNIVGSREFLASEV